MGELLGIVVTLLPFWAHGLVILGAIAMIAVSADRVVDHAAYLAKRLGISELVIGLTVVAFGTSVPEFAVTLIAVFRGQDDLSVSNIVGSNIFNLGFILGGCALVRAIPIGLPLLRRDGTVIGATTLLLLVLVGWDLRLDRYDGALLFGLLLCYLAYLFRQRRTTAEPETKEPGGATREADLGHSVPMEGLRLLAGFAGILLGSHLLVDSSTVVARALGVSEWVIGVTIVAAGTSAPELATSLAGVIKGRYAISAGNLIGSDIFNLLGVLGLAGLLRPLEVDPMARMSLAALSGMVFLVLLFMRTGWRVSRLEGLALFAVALLRWGFDLSAPHPVP